MAAALRVLRFAGGIVTTFCRCLLGTSADRTPVLARSPRGSRRTIVTLSTCRTRSSRSWCHPSQLSDVANVRTSWSTDLTRTRFFLRHPPLPNMETYSGQKVKHLLARRVARDATINESRHSHDTSAPHASALSVDRSLRISVDSSRVVVNQRCRARSPRCRRRRTSPRARREKKLLDDPFLARDARCRREFACTRTTAPSTLDAHVSLVGAQSWRTSRATRAERNRRNTKPGTVVPGFDGVAPSRFELPLPP